MSSRSEVASQRAGADRAEVGARADLLLVASDPLTAALPLVPDGVMVRGRWLSRQSLEAALADLARRNAS